MNILSFLTNGYTGSGIVITCSNKVLMQLRKCPRRWAFIGGGYNRKIDKDLLSCAIREVYEETGILINSDLVDKKPIHSLGFSPFKWVLYHASIDALVEPNGELSFKKEYVKYKWVNIDNFESEINAGESKKYKLFFFVKHQMRLLKKRLSTF